MKLYGPALKNFDVLGTEYYTGKDGCVYFYDETGTALSEIVNPNVAQELHNLGCQPYDAVCAIVEALYPPGSGEGGEPGPPGEQGPPGPTAVSADPNNQATLGSDGLLFVLDAPVDGNTYGRHNNAWTQIRTTPGGPPNSGIPEAPTDGVLYGRQNGVWVPATPEAPQDGNTYGRGNATWVAVAGPPDLIDGGNWT